MPVNEYVRVTKKKKVWMLTENEKHYLLSLSLYDYVKIIFIERKYDETKLFNFC